MAQRSGVGRFRTNYESPERVYQAGFAEGLCVQEAELLAQRLEGEHVTDV